MNGSIEPPVSRYIRETWKGTVRVRTQDEGTHLGLPYPYTVPCVKDGFDTLFYWDTSLLSGLTHLLQFEKSACS
jgi:alpha,alpha-trehalase